MSSLSALPDHEVARILVPEADRTHLTGDAAAQRISGNPGVLPLAVDPRRGRIYWGDIADHPLKEWQYTYTMQFLSETGTIGESFTTDFDVLLEDGLITDGIDPDAFIFHISRCGSTLIAKALARVDYNIVINQGSPLQHGFWAQLTDGFRRPLEPTDENLTAFRTIIRAMARRRRDSQNSAIVKFVSWNTLCIDFIRQAFPGVPSLFMYRDPVEVIASVIQRPTPALVAKGNRLGALISRGAAGADTHESDIQYLARCTANYFRAALEAAGHGDLTLLNYRNISPETFEDILNRGLSLHPSRVELETMKKQFRFHSKDDANEKEFRGDGARKASLIPDDGKAGIVSECGNLMAGLDQSPQNLFKAS